MKYGISLKIDVSKIDKKHLFSGQKGTYLDAVVFVDVDNKDQYENNGMIKQDGKDLDKATSPILGNAKVFWKGEGPAQQPQQQGGYNKQQPNPKQAQKLPNGMQEPDFDFDSDIPF